MNATRSSTQGHVRSYSSCFQSVCYYIVADVGERLRAEALTELSEVEAAGRHWRPRRVECTVSYRCTHRSDRPIRRSGRPFDVDRRRARVPQDAPANRPVLADSGGEDDRIESTEGGCERSELPVDAVAVEIDREVRARFA